VAATKATAATDTARATIVRARGSPDRIVASAGNWNEEWNNQVSGHELCREEQQGGRPSPRPK
jgi:hypothetical protein